MGLDITAYRGLTKAVGSEAFDETGELLYDDGWIQFSVHPDFAGRADEIEDRHAYKAAETFGFCAGSYSGYSAWREALATLAAYPVAVPRDDDDRGYVARNPHASAAWYHPETRTMPFYELVNFSDCEGVIGAAVSAKLAADFAQFQEKADASPNEWFRAKYADWRKAFEMAADRGAVSFH